MKDNTQMIVLGLAGLAVWMIVQNKSKASGSATSTGAKSLTQYVNEIFNAGGQAFDNGWRYFSDGTAIDPQGNYYLNGQMVYQAQSLGSMSA